MSSFQPPAGVQPPEAEQLTYEPVTSFTGPFRFLSNFAESPIRLGGEVYPTVEHAFQAAKTEDPELRRQIREARTPGQAKTMGGAVPLRPEWDERLRYEVMEACVRQKFSYEPFRSQLLATGDRELIEGNSHGDRHWGMVRGVGGNHLGRILMKVRDELRGVELEEAQRDEERREEEERQLDPTDKTSDFYYTDVALQMRRDAGLE